MDELPESSDAFRNMVFTEDEWTENEVWDNQDQMLMGYVPSQGIELNRVLSSWLCMDIPPMPPAFSMNNHVFILRLKDGSYAALQLENYLSPKGTKCYLTSIISILIKKMKHILFFILMAATFGQTATAQEANPDTIYRQFALDEVVVTGTAHAQVLERYSDTDSCHQCQGYSQAGCYECRICCSRNCREWNSRMP